LRVGDALFQSLEKVNKNETHNKENNYLKQQQIGIIVLAG
jgi:hypothetical protein